MSRTLARFALALATVALAVYRDVHRDRCPSDLLDLREKADRFTDKDGLVEFNPIQRHADQRSIGPAGRACFMVSADRARLISLGRLRSPARVIACRY